MPITATCPTCEHSYNVPDGQRGKRVRCRNCADIFVVGGAKGRGRDDDEGAEVELADEPAPRRKRGSDGGGSLRDRLDRDDVKSGRRKGSPDRDRDDDDDDDRPRRRGAGGNGYILPLCLGIGGVVLLLIIGSVIAVYYSTSRAVNNHADNFFAELDDQVRRAQNNPNFNPGPIGPIGPVGPKQRTHWDEPKNIDEALEDLRKQGNDVFMRDNRGNYIADRVPPNDARRKEVCDVLWDAQKADGHGQEATRRAFCKWAGKDQAKELLQLVEAGRNDAMESAAKLKLPGFEVALCQRLVAPHVDRGQVIRHLETLGQPAAEKELVKFVNHPDRWVRGDVATTLKRWNTKTELVADQCVADLGNTNHEVVSSALERIAERPPEATRRAAVVKAVKPHLVSTNHDVARHAANVALAWGTAEIAQDLIAALEAPGNPFDKPRLMEKLAEFNTEPCRQAIVRQLVAGDRFRAAALIRKGGAAYEAPVLEVFKSATEFGQKVELIRVIQEIGTMASIPVLQQAALADMRIRVLADNAARAIRGRG